MFSQLQGQLQLRAQLQHAVWNGGENCKIDEIEVFAARLSSRAFPASSSLLDAYQQSQLVHWVGEADPDGIQSFDQLLFRATRDGFFATAFHEMCDEKGPTIVVARKTDGDLFGGYVEVSWDCRSGWRQSKRAFLFSFASGGQARKYPIKPPLSPDRKNGILCESSHGVTFGQPWGQNRQDMTLFKCGAGKEARFCPGLGYGSAANGKHTDQAEVFATRGPTAPTQPGNKAAFESIPQADAFRGWGSPTAFQPQADSLKRPLLPDETKCSNKAVPLSENRACSHSGNPDAARFCMHCGQLLKRPHSRSSDLHGNWDGNDGSLDLEIVGFKLPCQEECNDHDGDESLWDHFRSHLLRKRARNSEVKEEIEETGGIGKRARNSEVKEEIEETGGIVTVPIDVVHNLQKRISPRFRNGRSLGETISKLTRGEINHLQHPKFVLRVAKSSLNRCVHYWTLDHRRLFCMKQAGKQQVRVKIVLAHPMFDEFVWKGSGPVHGIVEPSTKAQTMFLEEDFAQQLWLCGFNEA
eukprot:Skav214365  [mRNA]  locus=scaffold86:651312:655028:+ [translate_table: standard]